MSRPPCIALIATGGTIAGAAPSAAQTSDYEIGGVDATALLAGLPHIADVARVEADQWRHLDSKDMTPQHWLLLAERVRAALARPDIDGVVVTHGTDTLEETATALDLLLPRGKPVVLTCAMRPATALSADGPMNLYDAIRCAAHPAADGRGVMVCVDERILPARGLRKIDSHRLAAFTSAIADLGATRPSIHFFAAPPAITPEVLELSADTVLPRVELLYCAAGTSPELITAVAAAGTTGLVAVLPGNGSVPATWHDPLARAVADGMIVIRASRCGQGAVFPAAIDEQLGTLPAGVLSPGAARAALMVLAAQPQTLAREPSGRKRTLERFLEFCGV